MSGIKPRVKPHPESLDGSDLYAAESILDQRTGADGKISYLIKWSGWAHRYNTWEPKENIATDSLLSDYEERLKNGLLNKGQKRSSASASLSSSYDVLKKRPRGRPQTKNITDESTVRMKKPKSSDESKSSKAINSSETKQNPKKRLSNRLEKKSSVETDCIKPLRMNSRRVSRSSSQEQNSQSNSVSNSRRSSVASIQGRITRSNSLVDSSPALQSKSNEISSQNEELLRGVPDSNFDELNLSENGSSDGDQSVIPSPALVPKKANESDSESSFVSNDYSLESNDDKLCDKNNNNESNETLVANKVNLEPQILLERLPKFVFKRLISNNDSSDESANNSSYEISIKSVDSNDSNSVRSSDENEINRTNREIELPIDINASNKEVLVGKVAEEVRNESNGEVINNSIVEKVSEEVRIESNEEIINGSIVEKVSEEVRNESNEEVINSLIVEKVSEEVGNESNEEVINGLIVEKVSEEVRNESNEQVINGSIVEKVSEEVRNESNEEVINGTIVDNSEPIITDINEELTEIVVQEEDMDTEEVVFVQIPIDSAIDSESAEDKQYESLKILVVETETEIIKNNSNNELEITLNEDMILEKMDSNEDLIKDNQSDSVSDNQYSPVSEIDIECYTSGSIEGDSTQNSQNSEYAINEEVVQSGELDLSKDLIEPEVDPTLGQSIEKGDDLTNKNLIDSTQEVITSEETLTTSAITMNTSETSIAIEGNDKVHETSLTVDEVQDIRESDLIEIVSEEELYADSQSQDSQLSEQPKSQWTPQSDYVLREVDQQINFRTDFESRIDTDNDNPLLPSPPSVTLAQTPPHVPTPPLPSQSPTKPILSSVEPLHIDVTQPQTTDKSNDELQTTSAIIVDIILSPSQDSNVETQLSPTVETQLSPTVETQLSPTFETRLSPTVEEKKKDDKAVDRLSPITSSVPKIADNSVITQCEPFDERQRTLPSAPPLPSSPPSRPDCRPVADASNWPLLSQTNHPSHPTMRSTLICNQRPALIQPIGDSYPYRPVIQSPQRHNIITNESMRIPLPQMSSQHPQVIQRMLSRQPHSQLSHQFVQRMPSYPDLMRVNPGLMHCYRQTSAQHFSPPDRPEMHAIRQLSSMRPEFSQTNRQLTPLTDVRMRSRMPTNTHTIGSELRPMGPEMRHQSGLQLRHQSGLQSRHPPYQQMRSVSGPLNSRFQRITSPYDQRQITPIDTSHPPQFMRHLEQRLRGLPSNLPQQSCCDRMTCIPPPNIPITCQPMIRTPYTLEFQKKIVVEPKQLDIREKLRQTHNSPDIPPNIPLNSRREPFEARYQHSQRVAYNDNITNKELEVQQILEGNISFRKDDSSINSNRSDSRSVIFGGNKSNQFNIPLNTSNRNDGNIDNGNRMQILQRLLSQSPNDQNNGIKQNDSINSIQNEVQSQVRSLSSSSTSTTKSGHKDILTEAMEEIELTVVFDEKDIDSEDNIQLTITDDIQTDGTQSGETSDNPTPEDGQYFYIYADENAEQLSSDELVELISRQGLQVVESDSQEEQINEQKKDSTKENENEFQSNDDIVIQIDDKSLEVVENDKTGESSSDLELQLLVIDDNESDQNNTSIDVQISGINSNNTIEAVEEVNNSSEEGMEWSLVVDNDGQSKSIPIVVQLTESSNDVNNEVSVNTESIEPQLKDSNNGCDNETESVVPKDDSNVVSKDVLIDVSKDNSIDIMVEETVVSKDDSNVVSENVSIDVSKDDSIDISKDNSIDVSKDDSNAVEIEESVEIVQNECSLTVEVVDNVQTPSPEPIQYVSMPTFCFNENNNSKTKSTEKDKEDITDEKSTENMEITDETQTNKQTDEKVQNEKEITIDNPIENIETEEKDKPNEENNSGEKLITNNNSSENTKIIVNEDLVNKRVQHPVVSSSVEDFLPNSPSSSGENVAQQALDVDVDNDNFMPNSPLSSSEDGEQVIAPTTTIHINVSDDSNDNNSINNETIGVKSIDKSSTEVPQKPSDATIQSIIKDIDSSIIDENVIKKRKTKLDLSQVPPKKKMSEQEMREFLHLVKTRMNGFEMGWTPKEIIGVNSLNSTLVFLVKWTNDKQSIVLSEVANKKCPQMVIQFYEKHINWDSDTD